MCNEIFENYKKQIACDIYKKLILIKIEQLTSEKDNEKENQTHITGIVLILLGNIIWSLQYILEEKLFTTYDVTPLYGVGTEGLAGVIYFIVLLFIFQNTKCSPKYLGNSKTDGLCIYGVVEDSVRALAQMVHNGVLLGTSIGYIFIVSLMNFSLIGVVKYGSAIHGCIISNLKTLVLWGISTIFLKEDFNWMVFVGFMVFVLLGSLIYNELIVLPFLGMNKNLEKDAIYKKEQNVKLINNSQTP